MSLKCRCAIWRISGVASDGSICRKEVWDRYLQSPQYEESIKNSTILGSLTHRSRNFDSLPDGMGKLKQTIGKDDSLLIVDSRFPAPVIKVDKIFMDGDWVYADITVFDENSFDSFTAEQIKRLKGLIRSGVKLGVSCVLLAYWNNTNGNDICEKIQLLKGLDFTVNASVSGACVKEILEDELPDEKRFSDREIKVMTTGIPVTKTFSNISEEYKDIPKTSKVNGLFTTMKIKEFSMISGVSEVKEEKSIQGQKEFSIGTLKERLRYAKMSPRMHFRRLMMDYKAAIKASGGADKMKDEDLNTLKSLFTTDILNIIKSIYPDIMKGKQISTLIGASSISKNARLAAQRLQLPFRLAMQQQIKQGYVSKDRYQKIQDAYLDFTNSLVDEVFGSHGNLPIEEVNKVDQDEDNSESTSGFGLISK